LILIWAWRLFRESVNILLESTPKDVDVQAVRDTLLKEVEGLRDLHDVHIWVITGHLYSATLHVILKDMMLKESGPVILRIQEILRERFHIAHATVQIDAVEEGCGHRGGIGECRTE
jgi:cobalt-zinc-cadmium efflux system protein